MLESYKRPPIFEAVIELRTMQSITIDKIERLRDKFFESYPLPVQNLQGFEANVAGGQIQIALPFNGFKMTGSNGDEVAIVGPQVFSISQLAPYCGWERFVARFMRDKAIWNRHVNSKISRIGLRFVNRIDVPANEDETVEVEKYLNVYASLPTKLLQGRRDYLVRLSSKIGEGSALDWDLTLTVAKVPPALIGHQSFQLDIDVAFNGEISRVENVLELVSVGRQLKNRVFEQCITDSSRELFNQ